MCGVPTPVIDAIIVWNQRLIAKEYIAEVALSLCSVARSSAL